MCSINDCSIFGHAAADCSHRSSASVRHTTLWAVVFRTLLNDGYLNKKYNADGLCSKYFKTYPPSVRNGEGGTGAPGPTVMQNSITVVRGGLHSSNRNCHACLCSLMKHLCHCVSEVSDLVAMPGQQYSVDQLAWPLGANLSRFKLL